MTDTTTGTQPPTPGGAAGAPAPQQPAPTPTPPANGAPDGNPTATQPGGQPATPAAVSQPSAQDGKTFTQEDVDRIITDRLTRQERAFNEKLAKFFGGTGEGDGKQKPEDVLADAQKLVEQERGRANRAAARSFAQSAQVKPERLDTLVGMVDLGAALSGVDANDSSAVDKAIKAAVEKKVAEFPEWKASAIPNASTANPNGAPGVPDIDAKIAAATKAGDHRTAIALKRQKAALQSG